MCSVVQWASDGAVAQGLEQLAHNELAAGSNPAGPTPSQTLLAFVVGTSSSTGLWSGVACLVLVAEVL